MPIYEYRCEHGHTFEVMQRMSDDPVEICETCEAPVSRVFHPIAVHFKGSGFYNTDYGTRKRARENNSEKGEKSEKKRQERQLVQLKLELVGLRVVQLEELGLEVRVPRRSPRARPPPSPRTDVRRRAAQRASATLIVRLIVAPLASVSVTFTLSTSGPTPANSRAAARESLSVITWAPAPSL